MSDELRARLSRLDLPLPLEPLISGAFAMSDEAARRERLSRAFRLAFQMLAATLRSCGGSGAVRAPGTAPTIGSWCAVIQQALAEEPLGPACESISVALGASWPDGSAVRNWTRRLEGMGEAVDCTAALCRVIASDEDGTLWGLLASSSTALLAEALIEVLEWTPVVAQGDLLVIDRIEPTDDGQWSIEATRMHGGAPQLDERSVLAGAPIGPGSVCLAWADGSVSSLVPWAAAESTAVTVRVGWFGGITDEGAARYETHLSGDLNVAMSDADVRRLAGEIPYQGTPDEDDSAPELELDTSDLVEVAPPASPRKRRWGTMALAAALTCAVAGASAWGGTVWARRRANASIAHERIARLLAELRVRGEHDARVRAEGALQIAQAQAQAAASLAHARETAPAPSGPNSLELASVAERRARAALLAAHAGHEAEALAAAVRATGEAIADGLPPGEQSIDALATAIAAFRHAFVIYGRREGAFTTALSPDGRYAAVADDHGRVRIWDTTHRHVVASLRDLSGDVADATFASDGAHLIVRGADGSIGVWDARSGRRIVDPDPSIRDARFSNDGTRVVTAHEDGTVRVRELRHGGTVSEMHMGHGAASVAMFSPDDARVIAGGDEGVAHVWNASTGAEVSHFDATAPQIASSRFSPDGGRIFTAGSGVSVATARGDDATAAHAPADALHALGPEVRVAPAIALWDVDRGVPILSLTDAPSGQMPITFSRDGSRAVIVSQHDGAALWNARTGDRIATLPVDAESVSAVSFSPDGQRLLVTDRNGTLLAHAESGAQVRRIDVRASGNDGARGFAMFAPDGSTILGAGAVGGDALFDTESGERDLLRGTTGGVVDAVFQGERLLTVGRDDAVRIWENDGGELVEALGNHGAPVYAAHFVGDTSHVVSAARDGTIRVWDENAGQSLSSYHHVLIEFAPEGARALIAGGSGAAHISDLAGGDRTVVLGSSTASARAARFAPDGTFVTIVDHHGAASVWDAHTGELVRAVASGSDREAHVALSSDALHALIATPDGHAVLWHLEDGTALGSYAGELYQASSIALSPDGTRLAVQGSDGGVDLRDAVTGRTLAALSDGSGAVTSIEFSPDGSRVLVAGPDGPLHLFDAANGRAAGRIDEYASVARYSPDGRHLALVLDGEGRATATSDTRAVVRVWDLAAGRIVSSLEGHPGTITSVAFSRDGTRLVTTSDDHTARIWDLASGQLLATLLGHGSEVASAAFSADGSVVRTTTGDGTTRIFPASGSGFLSMGCSLLRSQPEAGGVGRFCGGGGHHEHAHDEHAHADASH